MMNFLSLVGRIFGQKQESEEDIMKKFLIVGLGNIGEKYDNTRHNIGFKIVDAFVKENEASFSTEKLGDLAKLKVKGKTVFVLKPNTYMNLSGKAVLYWMKKENIQIENLLIITDDLNIDFGKLRIKSRGSAGGHNGLKDIQEKLNTGSYPRFRFGVGSEYKKGRQVDFVLGQWSDEEESQLIERIPTSVNAITSFINAGISNTMNEFNGK
ncbi:aminoacyl-tRNA hydrolase [uncultured Tenacibaculum sp.]|uniref:aminoacyl-tRNA hydrolase n=1 Tax=uncultured Tenacibaculum sp. TaxID=174713 RepID=UPI002608E6FD|nr:aminoacyl-tRNA hydrolase [uncultured Tenacibaculum sp.]